MVEMKGANTRIMMAVRLRGIWMVLDPCRRGKGGLTRGEKINFCRQKRGRRGRGALICWLDGSFVREKRERVCERK